MAGAIFLKIRSSILCSNFRALSPILRPPGPIAQTHGLPVYIVLKPGDNANIDTDCLRRSRAPPKAFGAQRPSGAARGKVDQIPTHIFILNKTNIKQL